MRHPKSLLACITGEKASLRPTMAGADVARRLVEASEGYNSPYEGIKVLTVDRRKLLRLAAHVQSPPVIHGICVNGKRTGLAVELSVLFSYSVIILKVEGESIMMHGMEDGAEPRIGSDLNWETIKSTNYGWNLGTEAIYVRHLLSVGRVVAQKSLDLENFLNQ